MISKKLSLCLLASLINTIGYANLPRKNEISNRSGNQCSLNPNQTEKILSELEDRMICASLSPAECTALFMGGTAGGLIAARKVMQINALKLNPTKDILCQSKPFETSYFKDDSPPQSFTTILFQLIKPALAAPSLYCIRNPGATARLQMESFTKAMNQEIQKDVEDLITPFSQENHARLANEAKLAPAALEEATKDYVAKMRALGGDGPRVADRVEQQIKDALKANPPQYSQVKAALKSSQDYIGRSGADTGELAESMTRANNQMSLLKNALASPCPIEGQIRNLINMNSSNRSFIESEVLKLKKDCPSLQVAGTTDQLMAIHQKRVSHSLATHHLRAYELDLDRLQRKWRPHSQEFHKEAQDLAAKSLEKINQGTSTHFKSLEFGSAALKLEDFGKKIGLNPAKLSQLAKAGRALGPAALLAAGKTALASTGVGALPVIAETAAEEALTRATSYSQEECLQQKTNSLSNSNTHPLSLMGYQYLNFSAQNCSASLKSEQELLEFLQLTQEDRKFMLENNDDLCAAVWRKNQENKKFLDKYEITCSKEPGHFQLKDRSSEKSNFALIQKRAREARQAGLQGSEYEDYLSQGLVSQNQNIQITERGYEVTFTQLHPRLKSCETFQMNKEFDTNKTTGLCRSLAKSIEASHFDYVQAARHCQDQQHQKEQRTRQKNQRGIR